MGYNTQFKGSLKFLKPIGELEYESLLCILGEDARNHPEWCAGNLTYIDLELSEDNSEIVS